MESLHCFFVFGWNKLQFGLRGNFRLLISNLNSIQAGVFWNHIGWGGGGAHCVQCHILFLFYLWSNYSQTCHDGTLRQNRSKVVKNLLT